MKRSIEEINKKILNSEVAICTIQEAKKIGQEKGHEFLFEHTDIVTCAAFEMQLNFIAYISLGQTDPLIYFSEVFLNDVPVTITGPTDIAISGISISKNNPNYSGCNLLEDLISQKEIKLTANGKNYDTFKLHQFETWITINDINTGVLFLNQCLNQNNIVSTNSNKLDINSQMGTLLANIENSTYNSSSFLNPLINDPECKTIGIGSKIWIAGSMGTVTGFGSNHNPSQKKNSKNIPIGPGITLAAIADLKDIEPKWFRAGFLKSFGPIAFIGIGMGIPVLSLDIAQHLLIQDKDIETIIVDYSIPRRAKPILGTCTYEELRTSTININKKSTLAAPLSSTLYALEITNILKEEILNNKIQLPPQIKSIDLNHEHKKLDTKIKRTKP